MSIEKGAPDEYILCCDNCENSPNEDEGPFSEFADAVQYKKDNNWWSVKNVFSDEWSDLCPDCHAPSIVSMFKGIA